MTNQKKRNPEAMPIRSTSQIKEDDSKTVFIELIKPWMVVSWLEKDFGVDGIFEITKPIASTGNQIVTGKRVSVQLKSSTQSKFDKNTFSLSIKKEKINYWMQAFEPVILVYIDLNTTKAYYRWIDDNLIQELYDIDGDWISHDSVSVRFDKTLQVNKKSLNIIEKYALAWKRPARTLITPGNYFTFSNEAHEYANKLQEVCDQYRIQSLRNEVNDLSKSVSSSIYTIAIIGLSRVGKSTLINALLNREISPMGKLPTTGVPITIFPKDENRAFISFKDNTSTEGEANSSFLAEYTSQSKNKKNIKGVKHVRVHVINTLLERGFALCDVPGLDDADPEIKGIAKTAIFNSNAIIYVISLAGYTHGEFRINDQNISDLNELRGKMDRVFLVFNKADELDEDDLREVMEYINLTLEEFDILDFLAVPPIFISSKSAFERRIKNEPGTDTVSVLEQTLWEYLINQNRTGLHKIISNFANNLELINKLQNISNVRLEHSDKGEVIKTEINKVKNEILNLRSFINQKREIIYNEINRYIVDRFLNVINHMSNELNEIHEKGGLPNNQRISNHLQNEAYKILSDVYEFLQRETFVLQGDINKWVSEKLKQVELSLDEVINNQQFQMPEISIFTGQVYSFFIDNQGKHIGFIETIFEGIAQVLEWVVDGVANLFTEDEKILKREVQKLVNRSRKSYNQIQTQLLQNVSIYLNGICQGILEKTSDRTNVYLGELYNESKKLDVPLTFQEREDHTQFVEKLKEIESQIYSQLNHLQDYTFGIDVFKAEQ